MTYKHHNKQASNKKNNSKQIAQKQNVKLNGWFNESIHIKYDQVKEIGNFGGKGKKLFGYLPEEYNEKSWHNALDRGFATTAKGSHGVKILEKKLFELKDCSANARLFTKVIYKNSAGHSLAIFDHETNHKGIEREVNKATDLEIINCASELYVADNLNVHHADYLDVLGAEISHEIYSY